MKVFSTEKSKLLAEQNGWSLPFAQGFVDGQTCRRLGKTPLRWTIVGIDEYSLGFRAGYFEREDPEERRITKRADADEPVDIATVRARNR